MITIIDYGMGNLRSVAKAFESLGKEVQITDSVEEIQTANILVLPGVGHFGAAMEELRKKDLVGPIKDYVASGRKFIGVCLGMQLILDSSEEAPGTEGLGLIKGKCLRFPTRSKMPVPHMGWNIVRAPKDNERATELYDGIAEGSYFYFVHSFYVKPEEEVFTAGITEYGFDYTSIIMKDNVIATQFHPEKSQKVGLKLLDNILKI